MKSPLPDVTIPDVSLTQLIFQKMEEHGDAPAMVDGLTGKLMSYRNMRQHIAKMAASLHKRGLRKGDIVFICTPNCMEFPISLYAAVHLGAILTTCNPLYTVDEIATQLHDSHPKFIITYTGEVANRVKEASQTLEKIQEIFVIGPCAKGFTPFEDLYATDVDDITDVPGASINPRQDVACVLYSSGTTGKPKGVMLTHYNLVANLHQAFSATLVTDDFLMGKQSISAVLPFFHGFGLTFTLISTVYFGNSAVILQRFVLETYLKAIQEYKINLLFLVPPIALLLAKHPLIDKYDLSSLDEIYSGAAPLGHELGKELSTRLKIRNIRQGYGLTEITTCGISMPLHTTNFGSAGIQIPNTECKVVDLHTGKTLGPNQDGEVWIRGPQVMKGYFKNPNATANCIDKDGWFHSGDIGHFDHDGYFYIVDRLKELIKYKGFQVPPAELESVLLTHPAVADVAVVGVPDVAAGELPRAYIVTKDRAHVTESDIIKFIEKKCAPHKRLRGGVEFIKEIPTSPSGKILRRILRERARQIKSKM